MNGIANMYQSTNLNWHYNKTNADYESNTDDQYCDFSLVNSLGESASLLDNLVMNCGDGIGNFTREENTEAAAYQTIVVRQFAGTAAYSWLSQEINKAASSGSVSGDETFGSVAVLVNLSSGGLDVSILSNGV